MKVAVVIGILLMYAGLACGQTAMQRGDSVVQRLDSVRHWKNNKLEKVDSSYQRAGHQVQKLTSLPSEKLAKLDSIVRGDSLLQHNIHRLDSIRERLAMRREALDPREKLKLDSIQGLLSDYLTQLADRSKLPGVSKVSAKFDSVKNNNALEKGLGSVQGKQEKLMSATDAPTVAVQQKLTQLSGEAGGMGNLPPGINLDKPGVTFPTAPNVNVPNMNLPSGTMPNIPTADLPSLDIPKDAGALNNLDIPTTGIQMPDKLALPDAKALQEKAPGLPNQVNEYAGEIKSLKSDSAVAEKLEEKAESMLTNEAGAIHQQENFIKEQQEQIKSYKNPEAYKKQTRERAKKMVAQALAAQEGLLREAAAKMSKYQKTAGTVFMASGKLPAKRDKLKKLKTIEKFVPGIAFQVQSPAGGCLIDIGPTLRYRMTSYWSAGLGWSERLRFGTPPPQYQNRVFGGRAFTEVVIFKGFSVRLETEAVSTFLQQSNLNPQDAGQRKWVWGFNGGIKKEFQFLRQVVGNVQFMYAFWGLNEDNIYPNRFNVRFGFEPVLKKRKKK